MEKMKNITYGYANEGAGLIYTHCVDKASQTHWIYTAHAQLFRSKEEADDRTFKCLALQIKFDKST